MPITWVRDCISGINGSFVNININGGIMVPLMVIDMTCTITNVANDVFVCMAVLIVSFVLFEDISMF